MRNFKVIFFAFVFVFGSLVSCDDRLDINTDPLAATTADPNAVLPYVFVAYSARKVTDLGTRICDVPQYISATYNSPVNGSTGSTITGNTWDTYYTDALGNLTLVKQDALDAGPTNNNVAAIATIFSAQIFYELTSIFEDVPFTEALDGQEFPSPKFDSQENVLFGILDLLDEGMAFIDNRETDGEFVITPSSDQLFGGDMDKWRIYANSLKLRVLMMLRSGGANVDSQITTTLAQPLMESNSDAAFINYSGDSGARNGMFNLIISFFGPDNESTDAFGPGIPIDNLLRDSGDPRYDLWIARNDLPAPEFANYSDQTTSVLSNNIMRGSLPDVIMTPDEIFLYKAQLSLEGISAAGSADENYRAGISSALSWWGQDIPGIVTTISNGDISSYVDGLAAPVLEDVYNEQYLASFLMPILSWNHVRRNKFPVLQTPPSSNIGTFLRRFTYPPDETDTNVNTPTNKLTSVPMWFEN